MPILIAMNTLPDGGREWPRFACVTLIAGCKLNLAHTSLEPC